MNIIKYLKEFVNSIMSSSYSRQQLENYLKEIEVKANTVLDVGGSQNPVKRRTKSWNVGKYDILDLERPHEMNAKPDFQDDIQYLDPKNYDKYDMIFCLEVSEYWINPYGAIQNMYDMLNKGGVLYISSHFIYPHHNPVGEDCLRYTRVGITKLLQKVGFEVKEIVPRVEEEADFGCYRCDASIPVNLMKWFKSQGMRPAKFYRNHNEVGHIIKAIKE